MAIPVDIFVSDESPVPVPLEDVEVGIFEPDTHTLVASALTDSDGMASFLLSGSTTPGTAYEVRFFKLGVNFHGLRTIQVTDPVVVGSPNKFDHTGADSNILPLSSSPYLCRCTGVFVDFTGQPIANKTIRIVSKAETIDKSPKLWTDRLVSPDEMEFKTDSNGRISIDLIRTGRYFVTFGGDDDTTWCILVPDQYSVNFTALLHPFPAIWDWDDTDAPSDSVSLAVDEIKDINFEVTFTDYQKKSKDLQIFFNLDNSDPLIVEATYLSDVGRVQLRGLSPGTSTISMQLKEDLLPARWPTPTPVLPDLTVTVT